MRRFVLFISLLFATHVFGSTVLDDFGDTSKWRVIAPDGLRGEIQSDDSGDGTCLKFDVDFVTGGGFCVARCDLDMDLPENFVLSFDIKGDIPDNTLEFKLVETSEKGETVWWVHRPNYDFPKDWTKVSQRKRNFRFAWGPEGWKDMKHIGAIEFAVAAGKGGKGTVWIDNLKIVEMEPIKPVTETAVIKTSSAVKGFTPKQPTGPGSSFETTWKSEKNDESPWLEIDFKQVRAFGGLRLEWDAFEYWRANTKLKSDPDPLWDFSIELFSGGSWKEALKVKGNEAGKSRSDHSYRCYCKLPDAEGSRIRIVSPHANLIELRSIELLPPDFTDTDNRMFEAIAQSSFPEMYPTYFRGEHTPWTVVGVKDDVDEALIDLYGAVEVDKGAFRLEPYYLEWLPPAGTSDRSDSISRGDDRIRHMSVKPRSILMRNEGKFAQSLEEGYLPVPTVTWTFNGIAVDVTALATGSPGDSALQVRYRYRNLTEKTRNIDPCVKIRPFQVLPPWQNLNITGGVSHINSFSADVKDGKLTSGTVTVNDDKLLSLFPATPYFHWKTEKENGAAMWNWVAENSIYPADEPSHLLSGEIMFWDHGLNPKETKTFLISVPFHGIEGKAVTPEEFEKNLKEVCSYWESELNRVELDLPESAQQIVDTFRTTQAYILINGDGPKIQPGSRTYERSWIRDGALTSTALLYTGHTDKVRRFIDWYFPYIFPDGKVPCVVDDRGPDPLPEWDGQGALIYLLLKYYQFTHDKAFVEKHFPAVEKAVAYIEHLRSLRMTDEYKNGSPEKRACYGIVTESASHEGYCDVHRHSFWDSFFIIKGLKDAVIMAELLDKQDLVKKWSALRDDYRKCMYDSINASMKLHNINYIPGCVELGDFDATSTTIALFPCGERKHVPEPAFTNTFERYWKHCKGRIDGTVDWKDYTPYEVRAIGTFVRLGWRERAHELIQFFMNDRRPHGWNHWAEVVHRDPKAPRYIGDIPHTWVGSDFINAVRSLFVYEDESDGALVLAAGVLPEWLERPQGIKVGKFPTEYGIITYTLKKDAGKLVLAIEGGLELPEKGIRFEAPSALSSVRIDGKPVTSFEGTTVYVDHVPCTVECKLK